jgi:hypothetical protein
VWTVNSSGANSGNAVLPTSGTSVALEQVEPIFGQDLNADGVLGIYAAPGTTLIIDQALSGASGVATIGAGAILHLEAADSASVTFAGSTGRLIIDHSQVFTAQVIGLTGNGVVATSDVIDIKDVANATATKSFNGTSTSGTLTVSDAQLDTAHISLVGNYLSSTFTLSSDGGVGTFVVDPPLAQGVAGGVSSFDNSAAKASSAASLPPQSGSLAAAVAAMPIQSALASTQAGNPAIVANVNPARTVDPMLQTPVAAAPMQMAPASTTAHRADQQAIDPALDFGSAAAASATATGVAVAGNAVAREIVTPAELIRAIKTSEIAIKRVDPAAEGVQASRVWLFDEAQGTFVAPEPEPFTIMLDRDENAATPSRAVEAVGLVATAAMVATEPSWLGTLRQYGRKVAAAVTTRWMQ